MFWTIVAENIFGKSPLVSWRKLHSFESKLLSLKENVVDMCRGLGYILPIIILLQHCRAYLDYNWNFNSYSTSNLNCHLFSWTCVGDWIRVKVFIQLDNVQLNKDNGHTCARDWVISCLSPYSPLLAPQSGALRITPFRDFHPIPYPIHL